VSWSRWRVAVFALVPFEVLACTTASASGAYPHLIDQEHFGRRCTHEDTVIAGGTIVGVGGQVVAGGGGTGVGCDTFYAYELRSGEPSSRQPFVEPGYTLRPGLSGPAGRS
jgi:hypothetical protein